MPVEERWITAEDMAESIKKAKVNRKSKLGIFTRKKNHLNVLIEGETDSKTLEKSYEELSGAFQDIEKAHEDLCMLLEEDDPEADDSYLDAPSEALASMHVSVSKAVTASNKVIADSSAATEQSRRLEGSLAVLKASIETFGNPAANLKKLSEEKKISFTDMRLELGKIEAEMSKISAEKAKLLSSNPAAD